MNSEPELILNDTLACIRSMFVRHGDSLGLSLPDKVSPPKNKKPNTELVDFCARRGPCERVVRALQRFSLQLTAP